MLFRSYLGSYPDIDLPATIVDIREIHVLGDDSREVSLKLSRDTVIDVE